MKTNKALLSILFIFAVIISCDKDPNPDTVPNTINTYFPLHIGNTWEYKNQIRKVGPSSTINNKEYSLITSDTYRADTLYDSRENFYRVDNGKVYKLFTDKSDEYLFVDFKIAKGETWQYTAENMNGDQWTVTVKDEITFKINNIKLENCKPFFFDVPGWADEEHVYVFAPGIGEINQYSVAWGGSDTIQKTTINGKIYNF